MHTLIRSHRGSALLVGLVIVILVTILAVSFLEKVLRLSRTTGAIENSVQAYTLATGLVEQQMMEDHMTKREPWNIQTLKE